MKRINNNYLTVVAGMAISLVSFLILTASALQAERYSYHFKSIPLSKAIEKVVKDHPDAKVTFIYNELDDYTTSAHINTDNLITALRAIAGFNPVSIVENKGIIFMEALQKGKYVCRGRTVNEFNEPVPYATVLLLAPKDSTVVTYAVTKADGSFVIPCDMKSVILKITSTGYKPYFRATAPVSLGDIRLQTFAVDLKNVNVEAPEASLSSNRTVYVPLQKQKNSSVSAMDLLEKMAIPQLLFNPRSGKLESMSGKSVDYFIDGIAANSEDLEAMNTRDVKRVEYLEYPADPRFEGKQYVINFIMVRYEYGGYFRTMINENFVMNSGQANENIRYQYKKMTYDVSGLGFYFNTKHQGYSKEETFRLPQHDGSVKEFNRVSETESSKLKRRQFGASFKATYTSDNFTMQNSVRGSLHKEPENTRYGKVVYSPSDFPSSDFESDNTRGLKFFSYYGNYYLKLPKNNSLSFIPVYSFTHTQENSSYNEKEFSPVNNLATDNTNQLSVRLSWTHGFGNYGSLNVFGSGSYDYYRTHYTGSVDALDRSKSTRLSVGANYSLSLGDFYGSLRLGWNHDDLRINESRSKESMPFGNISLQYLLKKRHRISASAGYSTWAPSPSFKSSNIIRLNHLMSYTGNPVLVPSKTVSADLSYTWIPGNRFNMSAYGGLWAVRDRYVYDYEATPDGILRTIKQPLGNYLIGNYGISARAWFFNRDLSLSGSVGQYFAHNGVPYGYTRFQTNYSISGNYYLGNFYFNASYNAKSAYSDGYMVGNWIEVKDSYSVSAGWADKSWNLRLRASNFARWNWRDQLSWFKSEFYDFSEMKIDVESHAFFSLTATYTFNYGKKVKADNDRDDGGKASSGILKY